MADFTDVNLKDKIYTFVFINILLPLKGKGRRNILDAFWFGWLCWFCVPGAFVDVAYAYW